MQKKPSAAQISKFTHSEEFFTLYKLEDCGRESLYEHLSATDWDAYEAARDEHGWKCDYIEEKKAEAKAKCEALRIAEDEAYEIDRDHPLHLACAEMNADETVREGVFEEKSLAYFWCILNSHDGLAA